MCFGIAFVILRKFLTLVLEDHHLHNSRSQQNPRGKITVAENSPSTCHQHSRQRLLPVRATNSSSLTDACKMHT